MNDEQDNGCGGYLTADEVAKRFRVSPALVRKWARAGDLASIKLPGRNSEHRFRPEDVEAFERAHYHEAVAS